MISNYYFTHLISIVVITYNKALVRGQLNIIYFALMSHDIHPY